MHLHMLVDELGWSLRRSTTRHVLRTGLLRRTTRKELSCSTCNAGWVRKHESEHVFHLHCWSSQLPCPFAYPFLQWRTVPAGFICSEMETDFFFFANVNGNGYAVVYSFHPKQNNMGWNVGLVWFNTLPKYW